MTTMIETKKIELSWDDVMAGNFPDPESEPTAADQLPEAPASANTYVSIDGRQVQVTLRDTDEGRLIERMARMLAQYPATPAAPYRPFAHARWEGRLWRPLPTQSQKE